MHAEITHEGPAYIGESTEIHADISNEDSQAVNVSLDLLLQPGTDDSRESFAERVVQLKLIGISTISQRDLG